MISMVRPPKAIQCVAAGIVAAVFFPLSASAQLFGSRNETSAPPGPEIQAQAAAAFDSIRSRESAEPAAAAAAYRDVSKQFQRTEAAGRALFRLATLEFSGDDLQAAFKSAQKIVDDYPRSADFEGAIELQYKIASQFLDGRRVRVLGMPTMPSQNKAKEMFEQIIENGPFTRWAPLAQYGLGQALEKLGKKEEAIAAYQAVVDKFPASDVADDALYQIGYVYQTVSRTGDYDQSATEKAQDVFTDFSIRYPESEKIEQARENVSELDEQQTESSYNIARFYDRQKNYRAAAIYYRAVIDEGPGTDLAQRSQERLAELEESVGAETLNVPEPPGPGEGALAARPKTPARQNVKSRPDYVGPPAPKLAAKDSPGRPQPRTSLDDVRPSEIPEPPLPQ